MTHISDSASLFQAIIDTENLSLINFGAALHWLKPNSKAPAKEGWSTAPRADLAQLRATHEPGQNVGIRLGEPSRTPMGYIHLIDLDIRETDLADEAWAALLQLWPNARQFPNVISGSGGESRHVYFLAAQPLRGRKLAQSTGFAMVFDPRRGREVKKHDWEIDLLGTGKQAVLPPSIHPDTGLPYRWGRRFAFDLIGLGLPPAPIVPESIIAGWGLSSIDDGDEDDLDVIVRQLPLGLDEGEIDRIIAGLPEEWVEDRDTWLRVGAALHHEYRGAAAGFDRWCEWSKQSAKFNERDQRTVWRSFKGSKNPVRMASLIANTAKPEPVVTIDGFPVTEDGIALAFAARHADDLKFDHTAGKWFRWGGTHWILEDTKLAFDFARRLAREFGAEVSPTLKRTLGKASTPAGVEALARADRAFATTTAVWNLDPWLLATPGGTVDLRTGEISPGRPGDLMTKLAGAAPIPLDRFSPEADCPRWLNFLRQATEGDAGLIRFLAQWSGYCLTGDVREQSLLFVHGPGGSGKSTFIDTLAGILGSYAINLPSSTLTEQRWAAHPTEIARLQGHRLAYASETEQGRSWNENRIKELTGGDTVSARFMHKDFFEFKPQFKLTIVGNNAPTFENVDGAIRRRFNVAPFHSKPERPDMGLRAALEKEYPGILTWAIQGCLDWQKNGIVRPEVVMKTTSDYLSEQDTLGRWIEDECSLGPTLSDTAENLFSSWVWFASRSGIAAGDKKRGFPEAMQQRGFRPIKDSHGIRGRGYLGIRVTQHDPFDDL